MPPSHIPQPAPVQEVPRKTDSEGGGKSQPSVTLQKSDRQLYAEIQKIETSARQDDEKIRNTSARLNGLLSQHSQGIFKGVDPPDASKTAKVSIFHQNIKRLKDTFEKRMGKNTQANWVQTYTSPSFRVQPDSGTSSLVLYDEIAGNYSGYEDNFCKSRDAAAKNLYYVTSVILRREQSWLDGIMIHRDNFAWTEKDHWAVNIAKKTAYGFTSLGNIFQGKDTTLDTIKTVENINLDFDSSSASFFDSGSQYLAEAEKLSVKIRPDEVRRIEKVHESVIEDTQDAIDYAEGTVTGLKVAHGVGSVAASVAGLLEGGNAAGADALYAGISTFLTESLSESIDNHYRPEDQKKSFGEQALSVGGKTALNVGIAYTLGRVLGPGKNAAAPLTSAGGRVADMTVKEAVSALRSNAGSSLKYLKEHLDPKKAYDKLGTGWGKFKGTFESLKGLGIGKGIGKGINGLWNEFKYFGSGVGHGALNTFRTLHGMNKRIFTETLPNYLFKENLLPIAGKELMQYPTAKGAVSEVVEDAAGTMIKDTAGAVAKSTNKTKSAFVDEGERKIIQEGTEAARQLMATAAERLKLYIERDTRKRKACEEAMKLAESKIKDEQKKLAGAKCAIKEAELNAKKELLNKKYAKEAKSLAEKKIEDSDFRKKAAEKAIDDIIKNESGAESAEAVLNAAKISMALKENAQALAERDAAIKAMNMAETNMLQAETRRQTANDAMKRINKTIEEETCKKDSAKKAMERTDEIISKMNDFVEKNKGSREAAQEAGEKFEILMGKISAKDKILAREKDMLSKYITAKISGVSSVLAADITGNKGQAESEKYINDAVAYTTGYIAPLDGLTTTFVSDVAGAGWSIYQNRTWTPGDALGMSLSFLAHSYIYGPWVAPLVNELTDDIFAQEEPEK